MYGFCTGRMRFSRGSSTFTDQSNILGWSVQYNDNYRKKNIATEYRKNALEVVRHEYKYTLYLYGSDRGSVARNEPGYRSNSVDDKINI